MEKREVKTLIKWKHNLGDNHYVRGKISGIAYVILNNAEGEQYANERINEGFILTHKCDVNQYDRFINVIEEMYPGLCIFDYNDKKESE